MTDDLRVCLLCEETMSPWQIAAADRMVGETEATVTTALVNDEPPRSTVETLRRAVELREWAAVSGVRALVARLSGTDSRASVPLSDVDALDGATRIRCRPEIVDGWKYRLPADAVEEAAGQADVAVLFGFGFVVGPVLEAFDHGVLSFHHGDLRQYRGQPMGFWEYVNGETVGGVTLQRLTDTLDGGEILCVEYVPIHDAPRWGDVKDRLFDASEEMLAEGIRRVQDDSFRPETPTELGDLYTLPRGRPVATYVAKTLARTLVPP